MTELSYTAWDDKKYQWPPPDGWYQASDGKWWPEGYGPVAEQASVDPSDTSADTTDAAGGDIAAEWHDEPAEDVTTTEHETVGFESGHNGAVVDTVESMEAAATEIVDETAETFDDATETGSEIAVNGVSGYAAATESDSADIDGVASGLAGSADTAYPAESRSDSESLYDSESRFSTSSAGMAASGFASSTDSGSSSLGLAGWAQTGTSEIGNRVDVSHEYDYTPANGEGEDLLDPIEVSEDDHEFDVPDPDTADLETSPFGSTALDTSTVDIPADQGVGLSDPVDSTLSRLDDLKRQVEQQSFANHLGAPDATVPASDLDAAGFDPTETLDIDPNDLTLESNPYYGGTEEPDAIDAHGATDGVDGPAVGTDEPLGAHAYNGDYGVTAELGTDIGTDHGFGEHTETGYDGYGYDAGGEASIEAPSAAETRQYGYEAESPAPVGDQPLPMDDAFDSSQSDFAATAPTLSPMSSPTPRPGPGRMVLYAAIGLLALAVAGAAGYLLFQLQADGGGSDGNSATVAEGGSDAGASDLSGQEAGSFSNPHELAGGVRLTVPVGDDGTEVWMLQVREPATASDLGDGQVEVTSRIRIRNDSPSGDLSASGLRFVLVSADGSEATTASDGCSAGDDLDRQAAIEPGKDIEGNVCWTVLAPQATGALLGIESVHAGGRVHVQLS